jgi:hypothetical protein
MQERIVVDEADWKVEAKGDIAFMVNQNSCCCSYAKLQKRKEKKN